MPELTVASPPPRPQLLRELRVRLGSAAPGLRIVAEGVLGEGARIDFVGVAGDGSVTLVLVGDADGDLELVGRALAQRAWLAPRLADWTQLAPELGLRPEAGVGLLLLCPAFGAESRAAASALEPAAPRLAVYRCIRDGSGVEVLLEPLDAPSLQRHDAPGQGHQAPARPLDPPPPEWPEPPTPATAPLHAFRTGLGDADLEVTPDEEREFI